MKNIEQLFVSYKIAKQLKEKGFREPCLWSYQIKDYSVFKEGQLFANPPTDETSIGCPIYQQCLDFLRIKHNLLILISKTKFYICEIYDIKTEKLLAGWSTNDTYYEALDRAIEESLKLI